VDSAEDAAAAAALRPADHAFAAVQERLLEAWRADLPGATTPHLVVALPSFSLDPVLLSHYADRLPALEQRYLCAILLLQNPVTRVAFLSSSPVPQYLIDYYLALTPGLDPASVEGRLSFISPDDPSSTPLSAKLLRRPDLIAELRGLARGEPAMLEAWTVSELERDLAVAADMPIYGAHPALQWFGSKTGARRLFREEGVPCPDGAEAVATPDDTADALAGLRHRHPDLRAAVVKLNDSAAGDGNALLDLSGLPEAGTDGEHEALRRRLCALPGWYVQKLTEGGIVESWVEGRAFASPSVQVTITPTAEVVVLSTHEQVLGGHSGQVYEGCRLPADPAYAARIAAHGATIGRRLCREGVVGRFAVDFAAAQDESGEWQVYALEINLRKGGTTHPFAITSLLLGARYDDATGLFACPDGRARCYVSTDNLLDPAWRYIDPRDVIAQVAEAGLAYDPVRRRGVVMHMLECLRVDGRCGLTAIGTSRADADALYAAVTDAINRVSPVVDGQTRRRTATTLPRTVASEPSIGS
jgi:PGM1 C-terminal domain